MSVTENMKRKMMNSYRRIFGGFPYRWRKKLEKLIYEEILKKEKYMVLHTVGKGEIVYCIFRFVYPSMGVFSTAINYLSQFQYAKKEGLIPIIDWECEEAYAAGRDGECNLWDYVFEQEITVDDAIKSGCVMVETLGGDLCFDNKTCKEINGRRNDYRIHVTQEKWRSYYKKACSYAEQCWKLRPEIQEWCNVFLDTYFKNEHPVMGVMLRESFTEEGNSLYTGMDKKVFKKHPLNPDIKDVISLAKEYKKKWKYKKIFLSAEFCESIDLFKAEFENDLIVIDKERNTVNDIRKMEIPAFEIKQSAVYDTFNKNRQNSIDNILTYVYEVVILSKCDYFIGAHCGGAAAVLTLNNGMFRDICVLPDKRNVKTY